MPFIGCGQVHAGVAVSDIPAALDFYTEKLGFRKAFSWGEPPVFAGVNLREVQMFLAKGTPTPSEETGAVYFLVGHADQLYAFHQAKGVEIAGRIDDRPYAIRDYVVRNLYGYHLVLDIVCTMPGRRSKLSGSMYRCAWKNAWRNSFKTWPDTSA
jgi:catechol 2,3-dioxygenase-like lactoylglutathione lyase family enzyme